MLREEAGKTIRLALPIIFGELAQMALHIIDTAMVGRVGYKELAAAALVMSVMNIPFVVGIGITISVSQMVSMAHGRRDGQQVSHYLYNGFWLCTIAAIVISLGLELSKGILFHLGQDPEVATLAVPFMQLMGWSVIPMILFMALKQFTDGLEFTRTAMLLSVLALPLNVFINWLLIFGNLGFPRLELVGAGWGTLITRSLIFLIMGTIILTHRTFRKYVAVRSKQWKLKLKNDKRVIAYRDPKQYADRYGSQRLCYFRYPYRYYWRCGAGGAPDCAQLCFFYLYGFYGVGPGRIYPYQQCLWPWGWYPHHRHR